MTPWLAGCPAPQPGFVIWTAAALDPAAEEARFAAASPVYADIKKEYDVSRKSVTRTSEQAGVPKQGQRQKQQGTKRRSHTEIN